MNELLFVFVVHHQPPPSIRPASARPACGVLSNYAASQPTVPSCVPSATVQTR